MQLQTNVVKSYDHLICYDDRHENLQFITENGIIVRLNPVTTDIKKP